MAEVLFYHLEKSTAETVLPGLLQKTLDRGWRAIVKVPSDEQAEAIDVHLWTYAEESFLPHGRSDPDDQPVFITSQEHLPAGFDVLFSLDAASISGDECQSFQRTVILFDEAGAPSARTLWKALSGSAVVATYWRQSPSGKWEKAG